MLNQLLTTQNEWRLIIGFRNALRDEDYLQAKAIIDEMQRRIATRTLCIELAIDGFRNHDTGEVNFREYAELFEGVEVAYPEQFTRKAAGEYWLSIPVNSQQTKQGVRALK